MASLYEILQIKRKESLLKSAFIYGNYSFEGYPIIEIEAYDDTFLNSTQFPSGKDRTHEYFKKTIKQNANTIKSYFNLKTDTFYVIDYSTFNCHYEFLIEV